MDSEILSCINKELNILEEKCCQGSEIINSQSEIINNMENNMHKIEKENTISKSYIRNISSTFNRLSKKMNKLINKNDNKIQDISLTKCDDLEQNSQLNNIEKKIDSILNISVNSENTVYAQNKLLDELIKSVDTQTQNINYTSDTIKKLIR